MWLWHFAASAVRWAGWMLALGRPDAGDLGAHQGPVDHVVAQHTRPGIVPGVLQVGVQEAPGEIAAAALLEVHAEKGGLVDHVDPAQLAH